MINEQEMYKSEEESKLRNSFVQHFRDCPISDADILQNLGLFLTSKNLSRILFMHHIYTLQIPVHGVIMEFGTRWGQNLALFAALRGIYEPFNRMKKIIGFDTFAGLKNVNLYGKNEDGSTLHEADFSCTLGYAKYLDRVMDFQEKDNPLSHVKKYSIQEGDASIQLEKYLKTFFETVISLAFFDFDIYQPTRNCLEMIKPHLVKGSVLAFDEICDHDAPGETKALNEVFGLNNIRLQRFPQASRVSYFIVGE